MWSYSCALDGLVAPYAIESARDGIRLEIPEPSLHHGLLSARFVKIDRRRGVKIGGLRYGGTDPALAHYRGQRSGRSGRHEGKRAINRLRLGRLR